MLSRRDFLKLGGLTALAAATSGCSVIGREMTQRALPTELVLPPALQQANSQSDLVWRFLNRAGYGPRPGEWVAAQEQGFISLLKEQLHPDQLNDTPADLITRTLDFYNMDFTVLADQERREIFPQLLWFTLARRLYSRRQLYETAVEFWGDHFHVFASKNFYSPALKIGDDRDVIRPHALGSFRELLHASAYSPAMLVYLDNRLNLAQAPNENYARELLELHTVGVHAGYTQQDVAEAARALSGLGVGEDGPRPGQAVFEPTQHDNDPKQIFGLTLPAGQGEADIAHLLDYLAAHEATAHFIATKLVRRFVADDPPTALVQEVAQSFQESRGDTAVMLRTIFLSPSFANAPPKLKRPMTYMVSLLRGLNADVRLTGYLMLWVQRLGQPPFMWPSPDGYPDESVAWAQNLLARWNFALAVLLDQVNGVQVPLAAWAERLGTRDTAVILDLLPPHLLGRALDDPTRDLLQEYIGSGSLNDSDTNQRLREALALLLASPAFQWQ